MVATLLGQSWEQNKHFYYLCRYNTVAHNSCNSIPLCVDTSRLAFSLTRIYDNYTNTKDQPIPQEGIRIDPGINLVIRMASAASMKDSLPQAILNLHRPSSLDFRVCDKLTVYMFKRTKKCSKLTLLAW